MDAALRLSSIRSPDICSASQPIFFFQIGATDALLSRSRRRRRCFSIASVLQENESFSAAAAAAAGRDQQKNDGLPYTSMKEDPLGFWESHQPLRKGAWIETADAKKKPPPPQMRPTDDEAAAEEEMRLVAELRLLAVAAADRAEMHAILSTQRDNWNKLFQDAVRSGCATSCLLAATGAAAGSPAPSAPAALLCLCTAAIMALVNYFQPSQLAEEQRTAARLFRSLVSDIESFALRVSPRLRPPSAVLLRDARRRLDALDAAFPMPLTPGGLDKFPARIVPTVLRAPLDSSPDAAAPPAPRRRRRRPAVSDDGELLRVADLLRSADIAKYTRWAQNLVRANKVLAVAAPALALAAAGVNAGVVVAGLGGAAAQSAAAILCVLAMVGSSMVHDLQMGMVVEMYRNSAGYYADMEVEIREMMATMEEDERGDAELFRQKVAYKLGRCPTAAKLVEDGDAMAGKLF